MKILKHIRIWQSSAYNSILIGLFIGPIRDRFEAMKMVLVKNGMSSSSYLTILEWFYQIPILILEKFWIFDESLIMIHL